MTAPSIIIPVDFLAGTDIETAAYEATKMASALDVIVAFNFNGCKLEAYPNSKPEEVEREYDAWCKKDKPRSKRKAK